MALPHAIPWGVVDWHFSAFPRESWAVLHQCEVFPAGLCPGWTLHSTQGWMVVPRVASFTTGTAASATDGALSV